MFEEIKTKIEQTVENLVYYQRLIGNDSLENDFLTLLKCYTEERKIVKKLEYQLKSVTSKTKSQSQQIQDQRQRRLLQTNRADRLQKTIQHIYDVIKYRSQTTSSSDSLHYIKKLCEDRLREEKSSSDEEEEDDVDSHNCTIDDEQNESVVSHPRVVLPQTPIRKRLLHDVPKTISPSKHFRTQTTVEFCTQKSRPITITTDIQLIERSHDESSIEQTLPNLSKMPLVTHRFISKKIFRPETCFVCSKRINFGSISYRCSYCSQSSHVNCKENANSQCRSTANLPPASPRTPMVPTIKLKTRQRMVHSEPRKVSTTVQRRLPFERILLLKK